MIFYHVSTDIEQDGHFYPRIPENIMDGEISDVNRVCVAPTIADCLSAIPVGGSRLDMLNIEQHGFYKIFRIDTEKLGISDEHILTWEYLFENEMVPDAEWTEEHWITTDFDVPEEDTFMIHLKDWKEESNDIIPKRIYVIADKEYEGDYCDAYYNVFNKMVPCMSVIKDIQYQQEPYQQGDTLQIVTCEMEEEDIERLIFVAKTYFQVELEQLSELELLIKEGELTIEQFSVCSFGGYTFEAEFLAKEAEKAGTEELLQVS